MKLKYRLIKILLLTLLLGVLMNFTHHRYGNKKVNDIFINISDTDKVRFITKDKAINTLNQASENGTKADIIKEVNIAKTETLLKENPFIVNSNVYVDLNGTINISITQKIPIARVKNGKEEFYLDEKGNPFPLSDFFSYPCMLVSGNKIESQEYIKIARLCHYIGVDNLLKTHIIGIKKETKNSYNFLLNIEGVYIEYGKLENNRQKLTNLKEFYKQYLDFVGFSAYKKISLKYDNQIVATKR